MKQMNSRHPVISYHKLPVGGNWAGFLLVLAVLVLFLGRAHVPLFRYFFVLAIVFGVAVAVVLRLFRRDKPIDTHSFLAPEGRRNRR